MHQNYRPGVQLSPSTARNPHVKDYLRVLYRRRWIIMAVMFVILGYGVVQSLESRPVYEATVKIQIEKDPPRFATINEVLQQPQPLYNDEFYETQHRVLQSRTLARRTIEAMSLWDHPEFGGGAQAATGASRSWWPWSFWRGDAPAATPAPAPAPASRTPEPGETALQSRRINAFLSRVSVSPVKNSRLVDVKFRASDPAFAARVANTIAAQFIEHNLEFKFLASKDASEWLTKQLAEQRAKVSESEAAVQRFKETHDAVAVEDRQNIVVQKLGDLNAVVTKAKTDRIQKEAVFRQFESLQSRNAAVDTFPAILNNTYIQQIKSEVADLRRQEAQLGETFGERHPEMVKVRAAVAAAEAKLATELDKVVVAARNEYLTAKTQEDSLVGALENQKVEALRLNRKGIEYSVLERDASSQREIFESLLQRAREADISGDFKATNIRVLDAAEPPLAPSSPNRPRELLGYVAIALVLGFGAGFVVEYLDDRIRTPDEVRTALGVPFLGMVPALTSNELAGGALLGRGAPDSFSEALLAVRTSLLFSIPDSGSRTIVITSTIPGEGKTMIAANLAIGLARSGQRVILVDADLRRPKVHTMFAVRQEPGLSNVLVSNASLEDTLLATEEPNLHVLPAGHIPPNPADLVGSDACKDLVEKLKSRASWVVVDSPPALAVTDSSLLGALADGIVFVVGNEMATASAAESAIDQLAGSRTRVLGAVLNRVNLRRHGYYYAPYYSKKYGCYYSSATTTTT